MDNGYWVPISKAFADSLPRTRKFTELEAVYSLQLDFDNDTPVTISGCSGRWGWSRDKVRKFLADIWVEIEYDKDTKSFKKQKGKIKKTLNQQQIDIKPALKKHKRFIDNSEEQRQKNIKKSLNRQEKNMNHDTTKEPDTKPKPKPKEYSEDSTEFRLSSYLMNNIRKNLPEFKTPDLQKWSKDFSIILRNDSGNVDELKSLVRYVQSESFFIPNILSPSKFHKRFNEIKLRHSQKIKKKSSGNLSEGAKNLLSEIANGQ